MDEDNKKDINHPENQAKVNRFFEEFKPFINMHIRKLKNANKIPQHIEDDDLRFAGFHGLMDGVSKYEKRNPSDTFLKYAAERVQGLLLDHADSLHKVPKHLRTQAKNLKAMASQQDSSVPEVKEIKLDSPKTPRE